MSFEKLRVYQAAQELRKEVDRLGEALNPRFHGLFVHLDDATDSISNNIAEGAESVYPGKRKQFYDFAANSSREGRGALRSLHERGAFKDANPFRAIVLTLAISKMLTALIDALEDDDEPPKLENQG